MIITNAAFYVINEIYFGICEHIRLIFSDFYAPLQTDFDFRSGGDPYHHIGVSSFTLYFLDFDMMNWVPLALMHMVHLSAIKKRIE